jgi:hypothetical protein
MRQSDRYRSTELDALTEYIEHGVRFEFQSMPPGQRLPNTPTVRSHTAFVRERIDYYRSLGVLARLAQEEHPAHVQPLHIILKKGRKPRLVLDLSRNFNSHLFDYRLKYESIDQAVAMASPGCWFGKHDLSACYLSFPVHPAYRQFLTFEFEGRFYQFQGLPFGVSSAPRVVTSILEVIAFVLKRDGVKLVRYLDDFLYVGTQAEVARAMRLASTVFAAAGLVLNLDKTVGPVKRIEFLGIVIDSVEETLSLSEERKEELSQLCAHFLTRRQARRREVQSLAGKLSFAATVLPGARPFCRRLFDATRATRRNNHFVHDWPAAHPDLKQWAEHIEEWDGRAKWRTPTPVVFGSDASVSGYGFGLISIPSPMPKSFANVPNIPHLRPGTGYAGTWSAEHTHITSKSDGIQWSELFAVVQMAHIYAPHLRDCAVKFMVDNEADVHILNRNRTRCPQLAVLLRSIAALSTKHNFSYSAEHVAGVDNPLYDMLSRPKLHKGNPIGASLSLRMPLSCVSFVCSTDLALEELQPTGKSAFELSEWRPRRPVRRVHAPSTPASSGGPTHAR